MSIMSKRWQRREDRPRARHREPDAEWDDATLARLGDTTSDTAPIGFGGNYVMRGGRPHRSGPQPALTPEQYRQHHDFATPHDAATAAQAEAALPPGAPLAYDARTAPRRPVFTPASGQPALGRPSAPPAIRYIPPAAGPAPVKITRTTGPLRACEAAAAATGLAPRTVRCDLCGTVYGNDSGSASGGPAGGPVTVDRTHLALWQAAVAAGWRKRRADRKTCCPACVAAAYLPELRGGITREVELEISLAGARRERMGRLGARTAARRLLREITAPRLAITAGDGQ